MTGWRDRLAGDLALDVARLDRALGLELRERAYVDALVDPRGRLFQRLEYVGDSLLDAVALQSLVRIEPWGDADLSTVSDEHQALVSGDALAKVASRRGLPGVRAFAASDHRLADRIEAAIGAAWADSGIAAAEEVADRLVVTPGLRHVALRADAPDCEGDERYEAAVRACGHEPVTASWYGAAAGGGAVRRRLAIVGNAVLEAAFSTAQYVETPWATEAEMSEERRVGTSNAELAGRARSLGLVTRHEATDRRSVADEVQALVGTATMDSGTRAGLDVASHVLGRSFAPGPVDLLL